MYDYIIALCYGCLIGGLYAGGLMLFVRSGWPERPHPFHPTPPTPHLRALRSGSLSSATTACPL